jgi:hypothetical protein
LKETSAVSLKVFPCYQGRQDRAAHVSLSQIQIVKERSASLPNRRTEVQLIIWKVLNSANRSELSGSAGLNYPDLPVNKKVRRTFRRLGKSSALLESLRFPSGAARYSSLLSLSTRKTEVFLADPRSLCAAEAMPGASRSRRRGRNLSASSQEENQTFLPDCSELY